MHHVAVIDIGKTNAKVALVDAATLAEVGLRTRPNRVLAGPPYPHFDIEGIWAFILEALAALHADHGIDAISVTAHGASIVLLDRDCGLAAPMLDYEHDGPDALAQGYAALRPPFAQTGSPALPMGLNVGAQLHWLLAQDADLAGRIGRIVTYPQFWSGRLSGVWRTEYTSLGCHTDLWDPWKSDFSALVDGLDLRAKMAPLGRADECLGKVLPDIAQRTGLSPETQVFSGIHDSNASLLPHLLSQEAPFSVVSTGTWVIAMAVGGRAVQLDPLRDTLVNVNAHAAPTPSARFMGGREYELMRPADAVATPADIAAVLAGDLCLMPAIEQGSGPFAGVQGGWSDPAMTDGQKITALSFYLALMTAECLSLIGAEGPTVVEGPFARNRQFLDMLATATGRAVGTTGAATGTSAGAALLANPGAAKPAQSAHKVDQDALRAMKGYAMNWQRIAENSRRRQPS